MKQPTIKTTRPVKALAKLNDRQIIANKWERHGALILNLIAACYIVVLLANI